MTARIKTICCIHCALAPAFTKLGARVVTLAPPAGTVSLPELLADLPEPPDCVIHQEHLGQHLLLTDVDAVPCPTIFWAHDPHLNFFWQRHYARQFSAVASTQPHLTDAFTAAGSAKAAWITWHGHARPFVPHAKRHAALAFLGRVTPARRRRQWFVDHMARYDLTLRQDQFGPQLAAAYDDARLAPNECIAGEVNLRLFEAASSGCLPISERMPEAVAELFVPDREALYYDDVLELDDHIRFALAHPEVAEKMARAAHAAVANRHLPEHRAAEFLALAETTTAGAGGKDAQTAHALTLYHLRRAGQLSVPRETVWRLLEAAPRTPEVLAALMQLAFAAGDRNAVLRLASLCLVDPALSTNAHSAAACCLAASSLGEVETAKRAYVAWMGGTGSTKVTRLTDLYDYLLFFAGILEITGFVSAPGMIFNPEFHLPDNAAQCLIAAKVLRPDALEPERRLKTLMRRLPGSQAEQVGLLSNLTLHKKDDWSLGLELGLVDLQAFRREAGLEEVALAAGTAARLGQGERFAKRLARADPSGRLRKALGEFAVGTPPAAGGNHFSRPP
jgi:hypothetical protein